MEIQIHPVVFIAAIVVPSLIVTGVVIWVSLVQKKNLKKNAELVQKERENKLWENLASLKEKHILVLRRKISK